MNLFYINSVFLSVLILCSGCGNKAQQGTSNTENTSTATNSLKTNSGLQTPELPSEETPIQTRLQEKLESKASEHPAMVSLITLLLIENSAKKFRNQELLQLKGIKQWLCLNTMYVNNKNLDIINNLRNQIIDFLNEEQSTNKWEYSKCANLRREVTMQSDKSFLHHTQEALYNELDDYTKKLWLENYKIIPLICAHYSIPKKQEIHTITSMLPGFSDISSISMQLDGQEQDFEHTNLESGKTLFYSYPYTDQTWRVQGFMDDDSSVYCDATTSSYEDRKEPALEDKEITHDEYWDLQEIDYASFILDESE